MRRGMLVGIPVSTEVAEVLAVSDGWYRMLVATNCVVALSEPVG